MKVMFREEDCPRGWSCYLTPRKVYEAFDVYRYRGVDLCRIEDDDGGDIHIIFRGDTCAHINHGKWTILEEW